MGILRCILEGDARRRFKPRRISLVYETDSYMSPGPLGLRCFFQDELELLNFSPYPPISGGKEGYEWILYPRERLFNGQRRYIYSLIMDVRGEILHNYAGYIIKRSRESILDSRKLVTIDYQFQFNGLQNYRVIIGPFPKAIDVNSEPKGSLRHWGVRGYGELYFLIYESLQGKLHVRFGLPSYYNVTITGRIEGVVKQGYERLRVELEGLDESVEKRFEIIAYMDDLLL